MDASINRPPLFVGISGGTCSGKSTIAVRMAQALGDRGAKVHLVHMDAYYKEQVPTVVAPFSGIEYVEHNHPSSLRLEDIRSDLAALKGADGVDVVMVEGIFVLHDDVIRGMLDLKLFIDTPDDERLYRRIKRGIESWKQDMDTIASRYLDTVRFRHNEFVEPTRWHADLVINGTYVSDKGIGVVLDWIASQRVPY